MPGHWAEKYVGTPWTNRHNCCWLARKVLREEFGRDVHIPGTVVRRSLSQEQIYALLASELGTPVDEPEEPDCTLMRTKGDRVSAHYHLGLYVAVGNEAWVLHSIENLGCLFQPMERLRRMQLEVVRFYRWL